MMNLLGPEYQDCEIGNFVVTPDEDYTNDQRDAIEHVTRYALDMRKHVEAGHGLVFFGNTGTGKDHLQSAMLKIAIGYYHLTAAWVNGTDWYADYGDAIGKREQKKFREFYHEAPDILAISDLIPIGRELSDSQVDLLASVYEGRIRNRKSTWITVNDAGTDDTSGPTNFERRVGSQLYGRIKHKSLVLRFDWPNYRQPLEL